MKKIIFIVFLIFVSITLFNIDSEEEEKVSKKDDEIRAIYISYIELNKYFNNKTSEQAERLVNDIINNVDSEKFNWIILQVRSFSDSIYTSEIFPTNYSITRDETIKLDFDLLELFIEKAHLKNIEVHAWINPFRIRNETSFKTVSTSNPAFKFLGTNNIKVIDNKGIFYNPASSEVQDLITSGIEEIVDNYDIDGIHLDDYFYPDKTIDLENYEKYKENGGNKEINKYRLENINNLIARIYKLIKEKDNDILFGIAPEGNIENNYNNHYADIYTWLNNDSYVDYIMPQLYYGFKNENKPFIETLNEWSGYIKNKDILFIPAFALYKSGNIDDYAESGKNEWLDYNNIIANQVLIARNISNYSGFSIFRYDNYFSYDNETMMLEIENLKKVTK